MRIYCPSCGSSSIKKNGINQHGDQNHKRLECNRQFVLHPQNKIISDETKDLIRRLLFGKAFSARNMQICTGQSGMAVKFR